jgi:hypothetical protein
MLPILQLVVPYSGLVVAAPKQLLSMTVAVPYPWTDFGKAVSGLFSTSGLDNGVLASALYLMVGMLVGFLIFS